MRKRHLGFTLIELLVVIAIIALLVSILVPSLQRAKDLANTVVCANQEKNQSSALYLYAQEYGGWIPPHQSYVVDANGSESWPPWFYYLIQAKVVPYFNVFYSGATNFSCPLNKRNQWGYYSYSYGLNSFMTDYDSELGLAEGWVGKFVTDQAGNYAWAFNLHKAKRPQELYLVGDSRTPRITIYLTASESILFRHNGRKKVNMLFADGHVIPLGDGRVTGNSSDVNVPAWQSSVPWYNRL